MNITCLEKRVRYIANKNSRKAPEGRLAEPRAFTSVLQMVASRAQPKRMVESNEPQPVAMVAQSTLHPVEWVAELVPTPVMLVEKADAGSLAWAADVETRSLVGFENHEGGLAFLSSFHPIQWATAM